MKSYLNAGSALLAALVLLACGGAEDAASNEGPPQSTPDDGGIGLADAEPGTFEAGALDAQPQEDSGAEPVDAAAGTDSGTGPGPGPDPGPPAQYQVEMVYTTANIGRSYNTKADVQKVFDKVGDVIGGKSGPKFIGWQEIGEGDPCGASCEINALLARFTTAGGWKTVHPNGKKPGGGSELVKVPITSKGANDTISTRATFASPGWAGVSPTRFVVVSFHKNRNLSTINTHFIAGAWSCKSNVAQRKDYWKQAWKVLKSEVATEIGKGRNVVVTGDLNRPRAQDSCNPAWDPSSLNARASVVGGAGITMHVELVRGRNTHHIIEATFKAVARALRDAVRVEGDAIPSTKGTL